MQNLRLFEILYILLRNKKTTASFLAKHFEVSTRTIYRDIDTLTLAGIPIYTNKGKHGGIYLKEDFILQRDYFTDEEQNQIISALQGIQVVNQKDSNALLSKLSAIFQKPSTPWIQVDFSDWSDHAIQDVFQLLKTGILEHRVLSFLYFDSYGKSKQRLVEPLQLLWKGQAWYLIGFCRIAHAQRTFKLKRMRNILLTEESFDREFTQVAQQHSYASQEKTRIRLRIESSMAYRVYEEFPIEDIKEYDTYFEISMKAIVNPMFIGYLLSYGSSLSVVEPQSVKSQIQKQAKEMLDKYCNMT